MTRKLPDVNEGIKRVSPFRCDERSRLSRITTLWTLVRQAHAGGLNEVPAAQQQLLQRYCGAAYRYLLGALRNEGDAAELFQEFALRFLRGDFRRADPGRGRFRDYLKTSLIHLISDFRAAQRTRPTSLPNQLAAPESGVAEEDPDEPFLASWRDELMHRTWTAMESTHPALHRALLRRAQYPEATAAELADDLATPETKAMSAAAVRVTLHRARAKFAALLVTEVEHSLEQATPEKVTEELRSLGLLPYVQNQVDDSAAT